MLFQNVLSVTWQQIVMWCIGGLLIYLAIAKDMEPSLLLPIGFGAILVNIPGVDAVQPGGALITLFKAGIDNELFPLILFIGIGAMIDFGPLLSNPKLMIFGAAAQFGIFFTLCLASISTTRRTARPPSSWRRSLARNIWAPSWSRRIPICRWCPSSSRPSSSF